MRKDPVSFSKSLIRKYWISNVITKWMILQYQIDRISKLILFPRNSFIFYVLR